MQVKAYAYDLFACWRGGFIDHQCNEARKEPVLRHQHTTQRRSIRVAALTGAIACIVTTGLAIGPLLAQAHPPEAGFRHQGKPGVRAAANRKHAESRRGGIRHTAIGPAARDVRSGPRFQASGLASVYSYGPTASGERMNADAMTAAHPTLPFGSMVTVVNHSNGRSATVRINDRGPFVRERVIDLSPAAARVLGVHGLAPVSLVVLRRA